MLFAIVFFAAMMTLGELSEAVEANRFGDPSGFCVTGTVSYVLLYHGRLCHLLLEEGGVGVDITGSFESCASQPKPGDIVRIDGRVVRKNQGGIRPEFSSLEILGHGDAPRPRDGSASEIMSGRCDFHRSYLTGELRDIEPSGSDPCWNYLSIISDGRQYYAPIPVRGASLAQLESLVGSTVRLDGFPDPHNSSYRFSDERRFVVGGIDNITVLSPPQDDPFAYAPPVEALRRLPPETLPRLGRHKTRGRLMTIWQSRNALLKMPDGRYALVAFNGPLPFRRGQTVEVIGYPSTDGFFLSLSRAIARPIDGATFKEPYVKTLSEADMANRISETFLLKSSLQGRRIRLCGLIADFGGWHRERKMFPLAIAGHILDVDLSSTPEAAETISPGCRVQVTGTCVLNTENWSVLSTDTQLNGIRLVADRPDDVAVLSRPPWWTPARFIVAIVILLLMIAAILVWNRSLRHLSEKRGRELFHERTASALAELKTAERTRLAAEIHDAVSQTLTGAAMQLDAGEVQTAKRILASCRRELRECLWGLRNHALDAENFADAVRETLAPHLGEVNVSIDMDIPSSKMSESMRHAALSIIREAAVNAIRHGRARHVAVSGELDGDRIEFSVVDDGRGFDPARAKGTKGGHFGLVGMNERAKAFDGSVEISSSPGNGTEVSAILHDVSNEKEQSG